MLINCLALLVAVALLAYGADRFIVGAAGISTRLRLPRLLTGVLIVSTATSAPELIVSGVAAWQGRLGIAIGNALGSNIVNSSLVLGATALILPIAVTSKTLAREFWLMLLAYLLFLVMVQDARLARWEGGLALAGLAFLLWFISAAALRLRSGDELAHELENAAQRPALPLWGELFALAGGLIMLLIAAELLVWSATRIARTFGIGDLIIGLTLAALGTSLPELAASLASAFRNEVEIAIGNIIGSNIFNILGVAGVTAIISPGPLEQAILHRDFPVMLGLAFLMGLFLFGIGKRRINRMEGGVLLSCFLAYQYWLYLSFRHGDALVL